MKVPTKAYLKEREENEFLNSFEMISHRKKYWAKFKQNRERVEVNGNKKVLFSSCE